jgi:hypothetical protein
VRIARSYAVTVTFDDGSKEVVPFRFPSRGWWWLTAAMIVTRKLGRNGPRRLKDGSRVWERPDGVLEIRDSWHE